jgi:subtilisin family serine protease
MMKKIDKDEKIFKLPPYTCEEVVGTLSQSQDWGISKNNIPSAWEVTKGKGAVVMVLDTGDTHHKDLEGAMDHERSLSTVPRSDKIDRQYHSTHCSGIIGARNNDFGVVGVAPECTIITVKVLGDDGSGSFNSIIKGLEYAVKVKPDVVSMSLGAPVGHFDVHRLIKELHDLNIPCICAAGNEGKNSQVGFPARYPECIAVAAHDKRRKTAGFSSSGQEVFISAPGVDIYSTYRENSYAKLSGTSMATPFIAGVIALLVAKHRIQEAEGKPNDCKTVDDIKEHLKKYAIDSGKLGRDDNFGFGYIDVSKLIREGSIIDPVKPPRRKKRNIFRKIGAWFRKIF